MIVKHKLTFEDRQVRGRPGTVGSCLCGWSTAWGITDGSAEAEGHQHMMSNDEEYKSRYKERVKEWSEDLKKKGCLCEHFTEAFSFLGNPDCPLHSPKSPKIEPINKDHYHNCSCHLSAPCGRCENCNHADIKEGDCENDCQECELDHGRD